MKKLLIIFSMITIGSAANYASAMQTYSDDIPEAYIKQVKEQKSDNAQIFTNNINEDNVVKIHSTNKLKITYNIVGLNNGSVIYKQNINTNDKICFYITEDVFKNDRLFIKKNTPAIGIVRNAQVGFTDMSAPSELEIGLFTTRDVTGKEIKLFGSVKEESGGSTFFQATVKKNKSYTVYYK